MAFPTPESLTAITDQPLLDKDAFIAALTALMGNAVAVKENYRGSNVYSFYVEGQVKQVHKEQITKALREDGYNLHQFRDVFGYMPPPWYHDFASASHDVPDVKGYPRFAWTHIQISPLPKTE